MAFLHRLPNEFGLSSYCSRTGKSFSEQRTRTRYPFGSGSMHSQRFVNRSKKGCLPGRYPKCISSCAASIFLKDFRAAGIPGTDRDGSLTPFEADALLFFTTRLTCFRHILTIDSSANCPAKVNLCFSTFIEQADMRMGTNQVPHLWKEGHADMMFPMTIQTPSYWCVILQQEIAVGDPAEGITRIGEAPERRGQPALLSE